jgi:hypothetical protein
VTDSSQSAVRAVEPANARLESALIAAVATAVALAAAAAALVGAGDDTVEPLFDWQVSAFYDLNTADQAVYNALLVAAEELWYIHGDMLYFGSEAQKASPWPSVAELDEFHLMPPFVRDMAWRQQGEVEWQLVASFSFEGSAVYFGAGGGLEDQSAYLLALSHVHKGAGFADAARVWLHNDPNVAPPDTVTRDSLIVNGWREVVPYSGAMEVERLRG